MEANVNEKDRLYADLARLIAKDPSILRQIAERLESDEIVDFEGRPIKEFRVDPPQRGASGG